MASYGKRAPIKKRDINVSDSTFSMEGLDPEMAHTLMGETRRRTAAARGLGPLGSYKPAPIANPFKMLAGLFKKKGKK